MFTKVVLTIGLIALGFSGCSSSKDAKSVAVEICEMAKVADLKGLLPYIGDPKMKKELEKATAMIELAKNSEMGKKILAQQLEKAKNINCQKSTSVTKNSDGTFKVGNIKTHQTFTLSLVDGDWKMFR